MVSDCMGKGILLSRQSADFGAYFENTPQNVPCDLFINSWDWQCVWSGAWPELTGSSSLRP